MPYIYHVTIEHVLSGAVQTRRFNHRVDAQSFIDNHLIGYIHQLVRVKVTPDGHMKPYNNSNLWYTIM